MKNTLCVCSSGKIYQDCCLPFHDRQQKPATCEQLMRSRFSAFCLQLGEYLFSTYHPDYRSDLTVAQLSEKSLNWKRLDIINTTMVADAGTVEFKAWYLDQGQLNYHHELSNFVKEHQQWLYCDGTFYPSEKSGKIQRNDTCPCGSGKKYKKCCA